MKTKIEFKKVPALYKCFNILDLLSKSRQPLNITEISNALGINRSTVFNILYSLKDLGVLDHSNGRFFFGLKLYILGRAAGENSQLIKIIHPYLEQLSRKTHLSAFLGMRSGLKAVILDRSDSPFDLRISAQVGTRIPLLAGASGKVFLAQLSDEEVDDILSKEGLKRFTRFSCTSKKKYKGMIRKVRTDGIALDKEEYVEGLHALAVPIRISNNILQLAVWVIGLKKQVSDNVIPSYSNLLKETAKEIEDHISLG